MYICVITSTPVAAGLLVAGVSPDVLAWGSALLLIFLTVEPLRRTLIPQLG